MKDIKKNGRVLVIAMALMTMTLSVNAQYRNHGGRQRADNDWQEGPGYQHRMDMLDLSDEQKGKMEAIYIQHQKSQIQVRNQIREKEAQLRTQMTQDNIDQARIFILIDEIGKLRTESMKSRTEAHIKIRALLSDKQKILFDQRMGRSPGKAGHGFEHGLK